MLYHEQRIGRQADIVHTYHSVGSNTLSADDKFFAGRADTYLFTNWKPTNTLIRPAFSGQFQTAIYAAALRSRYSLWTSCGVR